MEKQLNEERIENIKQILRDIEISDTDASLIQDNKLYFHVGNESYRCVMPSQRDQSIAEDVKNEFKRANLGKYPTKSQFKKELKEKQNIDIDALEDERFKIREDLQQSYLRMATLLSDRKDEIEKEKVILKNLQNKLIDVIVEIDEYLSPCLEQKAAKIYHEYLTYACTEKCDPDSNKEKEGEDNTRVKWVKAYKSFEDFQNDNTLLANKAVQYMQTLIMQVKG